VGRKRPEYAYIDTVTERLCGEAGKDNGMDSTDTGTGEECSHGLPGHGQVDGDGVALFDTKALEDVGDTADFAQELSISDEPALFRFICLVDDGDLDYDQ
jgi:hypothetical protein